MSYNNCLFYTYVINDFNLIIGLISEAKKELVLNPNKPAKV